MTDTLRIIGGEWRGRKLRFPGKSGIRPTPDRVRETLFNWLAQAVPGSRCLDLFAGSGALGLEALSRGARAATFVEQNRESAARLRETAALLAPDRASVFQAESLAWLHGPESAYDIAFVDPPFEAGLRESALQALEARGWLAPEAFVYIEAPARDGEPVLPPNWSLHRTGRAGAVGYHLARRARQGTTT